jgi:hypothetical protein
MNEKPELDKAMAEYKVAQSALLANYDRMGELKSLLREEQEKTASLKQAVEETKSALLDIIEAI